MAGPPSRSSFPSVPGEPRIRRLGVGSSSGADRPLRAQVVVALVCAAMLIAVPLYLWRKPSTKTAAALAAASASARGAALPALKPVPAAPVAPPPRLTLGAVQKVRCGASSAASPNEGSLCDALGPFEEALKQAIISSEDCAPKGKVKGTINFVLTVDFAHKKLHVFPGASGDWRGKQARRATSCVNAALKAPDFGIPHQYRFYAIAILATYAGPPSSDPSAPSPASTTAASGAPLAPSGPALPNFE